MSTTLDPAELALAGAARQASLIASGLDAMLDRVPYYATYNATGRPAASVPVGLDADGLPPAVQLVRRAGDDATLLGLAAQLEQQRPWVHHRPVVS